MALVDTGRAIGAVTKVLQNRLRDYLLTLPTLTIGDVSVGPVSEVSVGKPEPPLSATNPRLNLFLYEFQLDASLRNYALDEGQPPPLWLVLKYLLTTFDDQGNSDSVGAHILLGEGMRALQGLTFVPLGSTASILSALNDNPEVMKLTFDQAPSDLLSKLMQGTDEKYRCSAAFEVRPVMIATGEPVAYSLLVGVNYQTNTVIGEAGIHLDVTASMGATIAAIVPEKFEANSTITIQGNDLNLENLAVQLGAATLSIVAQSPTTLQCQVNGSIAGGTVLSAGGQPISVVQTLPSGRKRSSNLLVAYLLPTLTSATVSGLTRVNPADPASNVFGNIDLEGILLGRDRDDVFVALYKDGKTVRVFDEGVPVPPASTSQTRMRFQIKPTEAIPLGTYRVILRVNGQQAMRSVEITLPI
jgi:Pvc16 N-terminal domain/IPT/TIG domain